MSTEVASRTSSGATRLWWYLGASIVLHGLLAVALVQGTPAQVPVSPGSPMAAPAGTEMIWFEGAAEAPSARASPAVAPPSARASVPALQARVRDRTPRVATPPKAWTMDVPATQDPEPGTEASQRVEQTPAAPVTSSPETPTAASAGASVAETAAGGAAEGAPGTEAGASAAGGSMGSPSTTAPGSGGPEGPALGDLRAYARGLSAAVDRQRRYPEVAVRLGMQGTAHVHLRVRRDGSLMEPPRLVASSGHEVLDAEALRMAEAAAPFEPLPGGTTRTDAGFVIAVRFRLGR